MVLAQLENVSMRYGAVEALRDVSLSLSGQETLALLGPNGAGKTTAIGLLTGLKRAQQGRALLFDQNPRAPAARRFIGVTPQEAAYPLGWRAGEILEFARAHYASPAPRQELVEAFGLGEFQRRPAALLSGGQQRRLAVALAFAGAPKAVFLDEPTTGLDADARKAMWDYVSRYKRNGGAVFLTTHYLEEAEALADRIILLNKGAIVREGAVEDIKRTVQLRVLRFSAPQPPTLDAAQLQHSNGDRHTYLARDADQAVRELVSKNIAFAGLEVLPASLGEAVSEVLKAAP